MQVKGCSTAGYLSAEHEKPALLAFVAYALERRVGVISQRTTTANLLILTMNILKPIVDYLSH